MTAAAAAAASRGASPAGARRLGTAGSLSITYSPPASSPATALTHGRPSRRSGCSWASEGAARVSAASPVADRAPDAAPARTELASNRDQPVMPGPSAAPNW
jgi:hypothetical protein